MFSITAIISIVFLGWSSPLFIVMIFMKSGVAVALRAVLENAYTCLPFLPNHFNDAYHKFWSCVLSGIAFGIEKHHLRQFSVFCTC